MVSTHVELVLLEWGGVQLVQDDIQGILVRDDMECIRRLASELDGAADLEYKSGL